VVDVGGHYAQAFPHGARDVSARCDISEGAVAVVVKQQSVRRFVKVRSAVMAPAEAVRTRDLVGVVNVTANVKIQAAVVVIVEPHGTGGPTAQRQASFIRNVAKRAVAV